ncbi:MAG: 4-hydroxythreonine-4-phosphate dehydrogenase PdxA, partial [Gemmatimonadota bacterium]
MTLGDPRGVGPEVASRAAQALDGPGRPSLLFVGPTGTGAESAADTFRPIGEWHGSDDPAEAGRLAGAAIETAVRLALAGDVDGIVTAPIDKAALHAAGYDYPGHTEMLAALSGTADVSMLMCAERSLLGGPLRVVLATTHMPLAEVPRRFTQAVLETQTRLAVAGLREGWAIAEPRVALCAFNPHASDGGLFGDEEET